MNYINIDKFYKKYNKIQLIDFPPNSSNVTGNLLNKALDLIV